MGIKSHKFEASADNRSVVVTLRSGKSMTFICTGDQYAQAIMDYDRGLMIQDAFWFLSSTQREFLMTGMDATEQARFYGEFH